MRALYDFLTKHEPDFIDDDGQDDDSGPRPVKCKFCGSTGLFWARKEGGWRLAELSGAYADGQKFHSCKQYVKQD
jgi:hypothetical protein